MSTTPTPTIDPLTADHDQQLMTVGQLSRRTGLSHKAIRDFEGRGLIYTVGRSDGNYRLFDQSALWCARTIGELRGLGLTLTEIEQLNDHYRAHPKQPIEKQLNQLLDDARTRLSARINELQTTIDRIDAFQSQTADQVAIADGSQRDPCLTD
jgi:DNA-binding transcriptional MerR regulator